MEKVKISKKQAIIFADMLEKAKKSPNYEDMDNFMNAVCEYIASELKISFKEAADMVLEKLNIFTEEEDRLVVRNVEHDIKLSDFFYIEKGYISKK